MEASVTVSALTEAPQTYTLAGMCWAVRVSLDLIHRHEPPRVHPKQMWPKKHIPYKLKFMTAIPELCKEAAPPTFLPNPKAD
jgi:hypothetical protein